jgi:cell division protein FtsI (penicillin-binding protein 3)
VSSKGNTKKRKKKERKSSGRDWMRIRIVMVGAVFAVLWGVLWLRAFQVQVLEGETLAAMAGRQHNTAINAAGERGRILDRNGRVLAKSVRCRSLYARPAEMESRRLTAQYLSRTVGGTARMWHRKLSSSSSFVWLKRRLDDAAAARIEADKMAGLHLLSEFKRVYPNGHTAGRLLGFTGADGTGLEGLELAFEEQLAGEKQRITVQRDARGRKMYTVAGMAERDVHGKDLVLTLDATVQFFAESVLAETVAAFGASSGMCLVVDTDGGDILAWAHSPFFNPNAFRSYKPGQWRNMIATDAFEPGSTMKPFVVAAALEAGIIGPDTVYDCEGGRFRITGKNIHDVHPYDDLPVHKILRYSSNIGTAKIGLDLGAERYHSVLASLGFGKRPKLPLPGLAKGIMRAPHRWRPMDLAAASFGHGISVTSLQMAEAYLALAGGGRAVPLRITASDNAAPGPRIFSEKTANIVLGMLRDAVEEDGTGRGMRIAGMEVGGKTGTAQKPDPRGGYSESYIASFAALLPATEPKHLVLVVVDEPKKEHYASKVAVPAVRKVAVKTLAYLGQLPKSEVAETGDRDEFLQEALVRSADAAVRRQAQGRVPDVVGLSLRRAVEVLAARGSVPVLEGRGSLVAKQIPKPGRKWPKDGTVRLKLKHPENRT